MTAMFTSTRTRPHGSAAMATPSSTRVAVGAVMLATHDSHHTMAGNQSLERLGAAFGRLVRPSRTPLLQRTCACGGSAGISGECAECKEKKEESALHRNAAGDGAAPDVAPPIVHEVLRSPGRPLEPATRSHFEHSFEQDFSAVRIHTGEQAANSAAAVNAAAYAVEKHIVFAAGHEPSHLGGNGRLLAHELTHVMQWGDRPIPARLPIGSTDGVAEREARTHEAVPISQTDSLQRAVHICDEYRAEDSGSAAPGPGLKVNVSVSGKRADVSAKIQVHGTAADAAKATAIQNTISSNWNGSFPDGYKIATNVKADYRADGTSEDSAATQIEAVQSGAGIPSYTTRNWLVGSRHVNLNLDYGSNQLSWVPAHEFGHLLGLSDRYDEGLISKVGSLFGAERTTKVQPGYESNIMGVDNGKLESQNVKDLIARYTPYTCTHWRVESPL